MTAPPHSSETDPRRSRRIAYAALLALAILYAALEYTAPQFLAADDTPLFDEIVEDIPLRPIDDEHDMTDPSHEAPLPTDRVKLVDKTPPPSPDQQTATRLEAEETQPTEPAPPATPEPQEPPLPQQQVDQIPQFPGGMTALAQWLTRQIVYPPAAQQQKIQGLAVVSFVVETTGQVTTAKIEKSAHTLLDAEAMRVIRLMPQWKPGRHHDKPCRTLVAIPVAFSL